MNNVIEFKVRNTIESDMMDPSRTHNLLLAVPNLDMIDSIMRYYQQLGLIKYWCIKTGDTSFITSRTALMEVYEDLNKTSLGESYTQMGFTKLVYTYISDEDRDLAVFPIAKKGHVNFSLMEDLYDKYKTEAVLTVRYPHGGDVVYETIFNHMMGDEWYKLNNLSGSVSDFIKISLWYKRLHKRFIKNIPDDYYMINVRVEFNDYWYNEVYKKKDMR